MSFGFVDEHRHLWPVRTICAVLGLSASGYYAWRGRPESKRNAENRALLNEIRRGQFERSRWRISDDRTKIVDANGLSTDDLDISMEFKSSAQAAALCDGKVDAAFWSAGMLNGSTIEATSISDIEILDLATSNMEAILAADATYPTYAPAVIPGGMYRGNGEDITTWGPKATLLVDASTSDDVVYGLVKAVFDSFGGFKQLHPAFAPLND